MEEADRTKRPHRFPLEGPRRTERMVGPLRLVDPLIPKLIDHSTVSHFRIKYLFIPRPGVTHRPHKFYRELFPKIMKDIEAIETNWRTGHHNLQRINCRSENSKGVYCLQYDDDKIVSGLRDNTIKIWDRNSLQCCKVILLPRGQSFVRQSLIPLFQYCRS